MAPTTLTSATLPIVATIGGDGTGVQVKAAQADDGTYELVVDLRVDGEEEGVAAPPDLAALRPVIASLVRGVDPAWLRSQVDARLGSMADDPYMTAADVLADLIEGEPT